MNVIGIDPGLNGGVVILSPDTKTAYLGVPLKAYPDSRFFIEKIPLFTGNVDIPLSRMCKLYGDYKYKLGWLEGVGVAIDEIIPQRWQKIVGIKNSQRLKQSQWKSALLGHAKRLSAGWEITGRLTLKTSDAFLIALAGIEILRYNTQLSNLSKTQPKI
jgi:hypothetical protein